MLLNNQFLLINKLKISLLFDNDVSKSFIISVNDIVGVRYKYRNNEEYIKGKVDKISCNFNSSIGRIESSIFIKIDGSEEYTGKVKFIKPEQITDLNVFEVADTVINPVVSVDNDTQRVLMIRENELGLFQYSKDGLIWASAGEGPQGLSAYEVAVKFGFEGSEQMWLESLKGRRGNTGAKGADGKSTYQIALDNGFVGTEEEWLESLKGEKGDIGPQGIDGKSAYQVAVRKEFTGTEEEWLESLKGEKGNTGDGGKSVYQIAVENGFNGTEEEWLESLKGEKGNTGSKGAAGKSAYAIALDNGFVGTEQQWIASLKGDSAILNMSFSEQFTGRYDPYGDKIYIRTFFGVTNETTDQPGPLLISGIKRLWGYSGTIGVSGNRQVIGGYIAVSTGGTFPYTAFPRIVDNDVYLYHYFTENSLDFDIELTYTKI